MPLYYGSILEEHQAVRESVGFFDVSHMGIFTVHGGHAAALLSRRTTANVETLAPGHCRYTFLVDAEGLIVDDLVLGRIDDGADEARSFVAVCNAATTLRISEILRQHRRPDTLVNQWNGTVAILAVQGPQALTLLKRMYPWDLDALRPFSIAFFPRDASGRFGREGGLGGALPNDLSTSVLVSRTGYTGELGYELYVSGATVSSVAERLEQGGARPCGLGARDTLRLEKGYLLSGQDFHRDHTPLEAGQDRFVEFDHAFVGRQALEKQRAKGIPVLLRGLTVGAAGAIPRHGTRVLKDGQPVGVVTSGGLSPSLGHGVAMAYLAPQFAPPGTELDLEIRGRPVPAKVVALPFVPAGRASRRYTRPPP